MRSSIRHLMPTKTNDQRAVIAYWLVPAKPERELFGDLIPILASELRGPRFEPHVTIFSAPQGRQSPREILAEIKAEPLHLSIRGIGASAEYRNTLFVRLGPSKALKRLVAQLRRATGSPAKTPVDPHLSLLYKDLPASARRQLAASLKLPFSQILFDSIRAVRCSSPVQSRADVEAWRVIASKSLK